MGSGADAANGIERRRLLDALLSGGIVAFLGAVFYPLVRWPTRR